MSIIFVSFKSCILLEYGLSKIELLKGRNWGVFQHGLLVFVLNNVDSVTDSEFDSLVLVNDNAPSRAASDWRSRVVATSTALAAMDEESASSAHLVWLLWLQVE